MRIALLVAALGGCQMVFGLDPVTTTDVVAHYGMETVGTTACLIDDSGHGHDGACFGDAVTLVAGQRGMAFGFDGKTRIQLPSTGAVGGPGAFTIAGWFQYTSPLTDGMCPFNRLLGNDGGNSWQICLFAFAVKFYFTGVPPVSAAAVEQDAWHHLAITSDETAVCTYVDGVQISNGPAVLAFDAQPLIIGADIDPAGVTDPIIGAVDDLWFFDRALTQAELLTLESP